MAFDYDPAANLAELADRSEVVTAAVLTDVVDGPIFASSPDDPAASRFALFVFESPDPAEPLYVRLPRPNTSDIDQLRSVMPLGSEAVLYLSPLPDIPEAERELWFNVPDDRVLWSPTTPQGMIIEVPADSGAMLVDVPMGHEVDGLDDAPSATDPLSAWLPPEGTVIPESLAL